MYTKSNFNKNADLVKYASNAYGLELDGRQSMDSLLVELNKAREKTLGIDKGDDMAQSNEQNNPQTKPTESVESQGENKPEKKKKRAYIKERSGSLIVSKGIDVLRKKRGG
ncbi:hypothetical protein [Vibrio astriarenae]|uniref:hypothetical protein n=1 Tax=Vibrio astriarenae TaxID=1481923 RepID=UPI0037353322